MLAQVIVMATLFVGQSAESPGRAAVHSGRSSAEVVVDKLDVLDRPDPASLATNRLRSGDRVRVVASRSTNDWTAIEPPDGSISWIEREKVETLAENEARVISARAPTCPGNRTAWWPGTPRRIVREGDLLNLVNRPPLSLKSASRTRVWLAIEPPRGEVRYVPSSGLRLLADDRDDAKSNRKTANRAGSNPTKSNQNDLEYPDSKQFMIQARPSRSGKVSGLASSKRTAAGSADDLEPERSARTRRAARSAEIDDGLDPSDAIGANDSSRINEKIELPSSDFNKSLAWLDERRRVEIERPMEAWRLAPILAAYRELLNRAPDASGSAAVTDRIDRCERDDEMARSARTFGELLRLSRERDRLVASDQRLAQGVETASKIKLDASGLLQPTSRIVAGQKAYALIAKDGSVAAFLALPPGVDPAPYVGHRVGVTGSVHYDEDLHAKLVEVRDFQSVE